MLKVLWERRFYLALLLSGAASLAIWVTCVTTGGEANPVIKELSK
jgi:hypothetical protein